MLLLLLDGFVWMLLLLFVVDAADAVFCAASARDPRDWQIGAP